MKIRIIAVGKLKQSPLLDLCHEYLKRMTWQVTVKELGEKDNAADHIPEGAIIVALDERGDTLTSPDLARKCEKWQMMAAPVVFLIGGADGFDNETRKKAHFLMSFGKQTWPHMMVRVMLLEQLYRAQQIIAGHPYHRA
jgi:23S rRNA (pseudouridine1915-N3)-methyltransferase